MSLQQRTVAALAKVTASSMTQHVSKGVAKSTLDVQSPLFALPCVSKPELTDNDRLQVETVGCFLVMVAASAGQDIEDTSASRLLLMMITNLFGVRGSLPSTYRLKPITIEVYRHVEAAVQEGSVFAEEAGDRIAEADAKGTEMERDRDFTVTQGEYASLDMAVGHMQAACLALGLPYPGYAPRAHTITLVDRDLKTELAGVLGLLAYAAGKRLTPENVKSFDVTRPQNIIDRYLKLDKNDLNPVTGALVGPSRPRQDLLRMIFKAIGNDTAARRYLIHAMVSLAADEETTTAGAAFLPFRLLRYTGMASYPIIANFLNTYDYAYSIPSLKGNIAYFTASCMHLATVPEVARPYFKFEHADRTTVFHRPDIESLVNVSVTVMSEFYSSLEDFEHDPTDPAVTVFMEIRERVERRASEIREAAAGEASTDDETL